MTVKVVTDSVSDLPPQGAKAPGITVVPCSKLNGTYEVALQIIELMKRKCWLNA